MTEQLSGGGGNETLSPLYQNDKAWTKERQARAGEIWDSLNKDDNDVVAIQDLRDLIVE